MWRKKQVKWKEYICVVSHVFHKCSCTNTEEKYGQYALDATLRICVTNMLISLQITDLIPNEKVVDTNISL